MTFGKLTYTQRNVLHRILEGRQTGHNPRTLRALVAKRIIERDADGVYSIPVPVKIRVEDWLEERRGRERQ